MDRIGVVDIGSNTVRLVVYDVASQIPIPLFNEKASCRLGAGLSESGVLNPEGVDLAIVSIDRFVRLAKAMSVDTLSLVATAAVRDADDGSAFVKKIERISGVSVEVLSGVEEARLAALGVMNGIADADGLVCDLGGGSLDIVHVADGACMRHDSMPFGHLRLHELSGGKTGRARKLVASAIKDADWAADLKGKPIYAVGGSIRALARLNIAQTNYPLHIVDNYAMRARDAKQLAELVSNLSPETLKRIPSVPSKRVDTLPMAAIVLDVLLEVFEPDEVIFSAFGMREGKMIELIPEDQRAADPLIAACHAIEPDTGRFALSGQELYKWMAPLFENSDQRAARNRLAACLLSDIGWHEHPDYRAEHAFNRALRLPFAGLEHADRISIATAIYVRYNGSASDELPSALLPLVSDAVRADAELTGYALRLGHRLAGSAPGLLAKMPITLKDSVLTLASRTSNALIKGEAVERRMKNLAQALDVDYEIRL